VIEMPIEENTLIHILESTGINPGPGIYEVNLLKDGEFSCTCPGYFARKSCKHTAFVKAKVKQNGGHYPLEISAECTSEEANKAMESTEAFRDFILKFGRIEVF
jgi:hypothetical protein